MTESEDRRTWQLIDKQGARSRVWNYFQVYADNRLQATSICKLCYADLSKPPSKYEVKLGETRSTSPMYQHLRYTHKDVWRKEVPDDHVKQGQSDSNVILNSSGNPASRFQTSLLKWAVMTLQPKSVSENIYFRKMCEALKTKCEPVSKVELSFQLVKAHENQQEVLKSLLHDRFVCLTTHLWNAGASDNFMTLVAHFINTDWDLLTVSLSCFQLVDVDVPTIIQHSLAKFGIRSNSITSIVSDGSLDFSDLNIDDQFLCFNTFLMSTINPFLSSKKIQDCIDSTRDYLQYLLQPHVLHSLLNDSQIAEFHISEVSHRTWWSIFEMFSSLKNAKHLLVPPQVVNGTSFGLSEENWAAIDEYVVLIKPFMIVPRFFELNSFVTSSFIPFFIGKIKEDLRNILMTSPPHVSEVAGEMLRRILECWGGGVDLVTQEVPTVAVAGSSGAAAEDEASAPQPGVPLKVLMSSALDPRVKLLGVSEEPAIELVWSAIEDALVGIHAEVQAVSSQIAMSRTMSAGGGGVESLRAIQFTYPQQPLHHLQQQQQLQLQQHQMMLHQHGQLQLKQHEDQVAHLLQSQAAARQVPTSTPQHQEQQQQQYISQFSLLAQSQLPLHLQLQHQHQQQQAQLPATPSSLPVPLPPVHSDPSLLSRPPSTGHSSSSSSHSSSSELYPSASSGQEQIYLQARPHREDEEIFSAFTSQPTRSLSVPHETSSVDKLGRMQARHEIQTYKQMEKMELRSTQPDGTQSYNNPLQWWKQFGGILPLLSRLAMRVLAIPATSAPAISLYTVGGVAERTAVGRSLLLSAHSPDMICLKDNWELTEDSIMRSKKRKLDGGESTSSKNSNIHSNSNSNSTGVPSSSGFGL